MQTPPNVIFLRASPALLEEDTRRSLVAEGAVLYEETENGCRLVVSHQPNSIGYTQVQRKGKKYYLSRIAWEQKHGQIPEGMAVSQTCGNGRCVNPEHLRLMAYSELNTARHRAKAKGESTFPPLHPNEERIEIMRRMIYFGASKRLICQVFGIPAPTLWNIMADLDSQAEAV